jgi:hypothetical protein
MEFQSWKNAKRHINEFYNTLDLLIESPDFEAVRSSLAKVGDALGRRYDVSLRCGLDLNDLEKDQGLHLDSTGLSHEGGDTKTPGKFRRTWDGFSLQRYVLNGEIHVVPHFFCPNCWETWGFKELGHPCPGCGITLGKECKILVDSDICPHCEEGEISMNDPCCDLCGFQTDPKTVVWG